MRCPSCQATNPDSATFCGQCYEKFTVASEESPPLPRREPAPEGMPDGDGPPPVPTVPDWLVLSDGDLAGDTGHAHEAVPTPTAPKGSGSATVGRFRAQDGSLNWTCGVCGEANAMDVFTCTVCGSKMDAEEPDETPAVSWAAARRIEMLAPGVGHIQVGSTGMGIARAGMVVFWAIGALLLSGGGSSGILAAVPFLIGILVVWATGPGDLEAVHLGRQPRLDARRFMFLVIGVLVGVIVVGGIGVAL